MQLRGMSRLQRAALRLSHNTNHQCTAAVNLEYLRSRTPVPLATRFYSNPVAKRNVTIHYSDAKNSSLLYRILLKLGLKNSRLNAVAYLSYEHLVDYAIDYDQFYKDLNMPDTMFSWFLVTELHIWMLMVRYMAEPEDGIYLRNALAKALWDDVTTRFSKLGYIRRKVKKQQMADLTSQYTAALLCYDEAILGDDKDLANALWRRMMQTDVNNAEVLEKLVILVRRQLQTLDAIPRMQLLSQPQLKWINYKSIKPY